MDSDRFLKGLAGTEPVEAPDHRRIQIDVVRSFTGTDFALTPIITKIIRLQESVLRRNRSPSADNIEATAHEEWARLLREREGRIVTASFGGELLGYAVVTDLEEFTELFSDGSIGRLIRTEEVAIDRQLYLYQISVRPGLTRWRIGDLLLEACKRELGASGLITDVLVSPRNNSALHRFYVKGGFRPVGELWLNGEIGELCSAVLQWNQTPVSSGPQISL